MVKRGKHYQQVAERLDPAKVYSPEEAIEMAKELSWVHFDETVTVDLRTNADTRHAEQLVRGVVVLPHGTGKPVRVVVFAEGEAVEIARQAGADYVGSDDLAKKIEEGWLDFEVAIANPPMMGRIGRLGRILGRRGLMPNPRTGTVVAPEDLPRTIQEAKQGRVEYRMDRTGIIHVSIGKVSFPPQNLLENLTILMDAITRARPAAVKGRFLNTASLSTTMGPGIPMDILALTAMKMAV